SGGTIESTSGSNKLVLYHRNITNRGELFGAGFAGLDLDGSVVDNVGGTIVAGARAFVYLVEGATLFGGTLQTQSNRDTVVKAAVFDGAGTHPITNDNLVEIQSPNAASGLSIQGVFVNKGALNLTNGSRLFLGLPFSPGANTTLQGKGQINLSGAT